MYKLVNEYGNITVTAMSESDRDRLIRSGYKPVEETANIDDMTVPQLDAFAKAEGIDLSGCSNKAEKLERIKAALEG